MHEDLLKKILGFDFIEKSGFHAQPMWPFRPRGALIWGAPPGAHVEFFKGVDLQAMASFGHAPARFFATADSFAQVAKMLEEGKEPPAWCTWDVADVGTIFRVRIYDAHFGLDRYGALLGTKCAS